MTFKVKTLDETTKGEVQIKMRRTLSTEAWDSLGDEVVKRRRKQQRRQGREAGKSRECGSRKLGKENASRRQK